MNAFTDTVNRDLALDNVSVYQVESKWLHLCCFARELEVPLCFSAWKLFSGLITGV